MKFSFSAIAAVAVALLGSSEAAIIAKRDVSIPDYVKGFKGTTYTPYDKDYNCRTPAQIRTDVSYLKDFPYIRLYSNACSVVQYALEALDDSQKLVVALNDVSSTEALQNEIWSIAASCGFAGKQFNDVVDTVIVGNELVYNNWYSADQVKGFVETVKSLLSTFPGHILTADTVSSYYGNPSLCEFNDYIGINSHPFFDNSTAEGAGDYVLSRIQAVWQFCHEHGYDRDVVVLETGWPSSGLPYNNAIPGVEEQKIAVKAIQSTSAASSFLFSAYNELWKSQNEWHVEKSFGVLGDAPSTA
ncbi:glycoside hydrolase family 17 protein [Ascoidea rubescens DSM 1968]|uniref:Glycoside hydrolase family 17 protein n=1 Tax=Ascoidea rubescens DSM 1968 TaxID=1344418 RepID=A0A1D2VKK5_9ASCO|nr:glycoside hydrolase family 17 protein [Ascoidea rubescens DSM 1968]ODV62144.1 glycoside hydrolase family 17 protein [Ascoidea rubescens DSM 1968]